MVLHPQGAALLGEDGAEPGPGEPGFDLAAARRSMLADAPPAVPDAAVEHVADLDLGGVPARLYRPAPDVPVLVHLHGGGFVMGGLDSHDALCRLLAARSGVAVLAVDYRLAPEHPWPVPVLDAETAVGALAERAGDLRVRADRVGVIGDSAGGTLAAAVALRARARGGPSYAVQVLVYPALDARCDTPSHRDGRPEQGLTREQMGWFWAAYAPDPADRERPDVSPTRTADLAGLPPALVVTAEHDVLRDEAEDYAARLAAAGVPTVATRVLGMPHGFWRQPAAVTASLGAVDLVAGAVRRALVDRP